MDVSKLPAATGFQNRTPSAATEQGAHTTVGVPASGDRAEIRPLDVPGALQILIAEVRLALVTVLAAALDAEPARGTAPTWVTAPLTATENATQAAQAVVEMFLQAVPDGVGGVPDGRASRIWVAAAAQVEAALRQGFDDALRTVGNWHGVSPAVLDAPREALSVTAAILGDDIPNPLWLLPEWVSLAPRLARYVRRRRYARRRLSDPDFDRRALDDADWA